MRWVLSVPLAVVALAAILFFVLTISYSVKEILRGEWEALGLFVTQCIGLGAVLLLSAMVVVFLWVV